MFDRCLMFHQAKMKILAYDRYLIVLFWQILALKWFSNDIHDRFLFCFVCLFWHQYDISLMMQIAQIALTDSSKIFGREEKSKDPIMRLASCELEL